MLPVDMLLFSEENLQYLQDEFARLQAERIQATIRKLEDAQQAIIAACNVCEGKGFTVETEVLEEHVCGGDEIECQRRCPVPVPQQVQVGCEYCGRPCSAITVLIEQERSHNSPYHLARMVERLKQLAAENPVAIAGIGDDDCPF